MDVPFVNRNAGSHNPYPPGHLAARSDGRSRRATVAGTAPLKVAMVSMVPAFPARAGHSVRIQHLCKAIQALGHDLTFIHFTSKLERQRPDDDAHRALFGADHYIRLDKGNALARTAFWLHGKAVRRARKTLRMFSDDAGYYSGLDQNWRPAWTRQLRALAQDFDVVIVEYVFNSRALAAFPAGTRKLLDTHDAFANRHRPFVAHGHHQGYWISLRPQDENAGLRRADAILAIQDEEADRFRRQLGQPANADSRPEVAVVSHLLELGRPLSDYGTNHAALYLGSNMLANQISLQDFLDHVLPKVLARIPGFRLRLAGSICQWAPDHPSVDKLGYVDDLSAAFAQAPLSINPTLAGTGINIKLLDALCAGVPTVSTATGVRGLAGEFRNGVVVVPDRDHGAFADAIVRLAGDAAQRRALGQAAYADAVRWNTRQLAALDQCLRGGRPVAGTKAP